jgi:hypothetical protein
MRSGRGFRTVESTRKTDIVGIAMKRAWIGALVAGLMPLAAPASAATVSYTFTGTTMNAAYLFGHPDPVEAPLPFTFSLYFDYNLPPTADGRTSDVLPDDPRDSYTIGGQRAFYQGLGGFVDTSISGITGLRELRVSGDTIVDYGFFKARSGYQLIVNSAAFTADYTLPGVYTDANAQLNLLTGYNVSFIQTIIPITGATDSRTTYLHLDKLVVMNSDYPPLVPTVPLPASLPLLGTALAVLGFMGSGMRRAAIVRADRVICA